VIRTAFRLAAAVAAIACTGSLAAAAPTLRWQLLESRPHDPGAFTQGLVAYGDVLLESTGDCCDPARSDSSIRRVDPRTGRVLALRTIPAPIFAEGVTVLAGAAWQLTWNDGVAYKLSPSTLAPMASPPYPWEGWGLTTHGGLLVASDGSPRLRWLRTPDLSMQRSVTVRDGGRPVTSLNELERLGGSIWANVWGEDRIALIAPSSGRVRAWLDMSRLRDRISPDGEVLNGIARDPVTGHVIVTGKKWDRMFVIRLAQRVPA
jgi:glutamine cyclotransferase